MSAEVQLAIIALVQAIVANITAIVIAILVTLRTRRECGALELVNRMAHVSDPTTVLPERSANPFEPPED